jgi:hypothetical protein
MRLGLTQVRPDFQLDLAWLKVSLGGRFGFELEPMQELGMYVIDHMS